MPKKIRVCAGPHCNYRKSNRVMNALRDFFKAENNRGDVDLDYCACTGFCEQGPNVVVDDGLMYQYASTETIAQKIEKGEGKELSELTPDIEIDTLIQDI